MFSVVLFASQVGLGADGCWTRLRSNQRSEGAQFEDQDNVVEMTSEASFGLMSKEAQSPGRGGPLMPELVRGWHDVLCDVLSCAWRYVAWVSVTGRACFLSKA